MELIITLGLIAVLVLVFLLPKFVDFGFNLNGNDYAFASKFWKDNAAIKSGDYYRLFTANFLHIDFLHLLSNVYGLFIFGTSGVFAISPYLIIVLFIIGGICGNICSLFFNPNNSLGASGSVFALIGFVLGIGLQFGALGQLTSILFYVVISYVYGIYGGGRIDNAAHTGGLLSGLVISFVL